MSIEFRCTHCGKLLATESGTEGKQARCPECGTAQAIPAGASEAAPLDRPFDAPPPREPAFAASRASANPYQAPGSTPLAQRVFNPTRIAFAETLGKTWRIYTRNLGAIVAGSLVAKLCGNVASALAVAIGEAFVNNSPDLFLPARLLEGFAIAAISTFFAIGLMKFMLTIARGETINFADLFSAGPLALPGVVVLAMLILGTLAGALFFVVPGVVFLLLFFQSLYLFIDQRTGIIESFRHSAAAMRGNVLTLLSLLIVATMGAGLFTLMTCGIGALLAGPFLSLLYAVVYLGVTGQATADDRAAQFAAERTFDASGLQPTV